LEIAGETKRKLQGGVVATPFDCNNGCPRYSDFFCQLFLGYSVFCPKDMQAINDFELR
jgi:hypothetical protein